MRRWEGILIGSVWMGWIFLSGVPPAWAGRTPQVEKDLTQKKKDLKDIKKELSLTKEKAKEVEGHETSILQSLHQVETQLDSKKKELSKMEGQLAQTKERLRQTKNQTVMLNRDMKRTEEELFSRVTALYKMGRIPPETLLLTSQSYLDLLKIDKYLRVVIHSDAQLVDTYRSQVGLKEKYQEELTQDQLQLQQNISEVEKKKEEIKKVGETKRTLLKAIQNQKVVYRKVIDELEERARELQTLVRKLEKEKSSFASGKPKPEIPRGKLIPPVQGKVVSLFKEKGQNGIEIQAPNGAEIRAVLPGRVLYADWFKGFGNIVIIDHGDHTITVSGYASRLLKKAGEIVSQGEAIALVGGEGSLKGPCLYFEVRHHGKPQDPMHWLSHLDKVVSLPRDKEKK
jgi:murein hydrolase activator